MFPQQISWLPFLPLGSHNTKIYASTATQERKESTEEGEDEEEEEEEEGREEEEEQRPLCSGVLGYPVVRDHTLGLGLSGAPDAQAEDDVQNQTYKGDNRNIHLRKQKSLFPPVISMNVNSSIFAQTSKIQQILNKQKKQTVRTPF